MKPANFPGRKNDRRKTALARMKKPELTGSLANKAEQRRASAYHITEARVLPNSVARGIRTKKDRSARGKLRP